MSSPHVDTPRPKPFFFQPPLTFSTKKERGCTPKESAPPRPPIKSAPPVSRIFPRKEVVKATPVTFKSPDKPILSDRNYNEGKKELYFDQCFDIDSKLGAGSFGEVFKVRSKEDGRFYAVKRSRQRFRGESDRHRKFEEVVKHETLPAHPNCVTFVKAWEEKQYLYIQTELCKTSLNAFAEENHDIPERLIWNYLVDLLMAVKHLHDHDLVHMDIKPENIFIGSNDVCKLGDFGLVIDLRKDVEISEAQEGDPKYLAPELMMSRFGKPADVFSVGISILELASDLDLPRGGDLWHKLRSGELPEKFLIGISYELKEIIRWMMDPDPTRRPTVDDVLNHQFVVKIWHERRAEQVNISRDDQNGTASVHMTTPVKNNEPAFKRPPEWDHSPLSDDELHDRAEGGVDMGCIHDDAEVGGVTRFPDDVDIPEGASNNSMGVPLDFSSSNSSSDGLSEPIGLLRQGEDKALTVPRYNLRRPTRHLDSSSDSISPVFTAASSTYFYSSSPISGITSTSRSRRNVALSEKKLLSPPVFNLDAAEPSSDAKTRSEPRVLEESNVKNSGHRSTSGSRARRFDAVGQLEGEVRINLVEPKNLLKAFELALVDDLAN